MPRSFSRDRSDQFIGRRDYFRRRDFVGKWKWVFALGGLIFALGWVGFDSLGIESAHFAHTHGELANPHAVWDTKCDACHQPSGSINFVNSPLSTFQPGARWRNFTCEKCHAGPSHYAREGTPDAERHKDCGSCHHDHGGRLNSLTRIADSHCTTCHKAIAKHEDHTDKSTRWRDPISQYPITSFANDHPPFRPLTENPETRTLKFSHALHMTAGLKYIPGGAEGLTLNRIEKLSSEDAAKKYEIFQKPNGVIELECAACHRLDSGVALGGKNNNSPYELLKKELVSRGEPTRSVQPSRAAGANFLSVNFEAHCRACHPLRAPEMAIDDKVLNDFDLPHRLSIGDLKRQLDSGYLREIVNRDPKFLLKPLEPGKPTAPGPTTTIRREMDRLADEAACRILGVTCVKCHDLQSNDDIAPIPDRTNWLPAAKFDHTAHRGLTCLSCHPGTEGRFSPKGFPIEKEPVANNILGIDSCRACHSPKGTQVLLPDSKPVPGGGIRHGCTDCHSYHNAGHPLQGRGADVRSPKTEDRLNNLGEFLRGLKEPGANTKPKSTSGSPTDSP